ncbi:MAG: ATP-binding protein [Salinispira sp.]
MRSNLMYADERPIRRSTINDIDVTLFSTFFRNEFKESVDEQGIPLIKILENMNLAENEELTCAGLLLFGKNNTYKLPAYLVKCVCYLGTSIDENNYIESQDNTGALADVFKSTTAFLNRNMRSLQNGQGINSLGIKEIAGVVFDELIANALIHRDYFISAPIRVFIFSDRIEIISPGHLPNNLTIENIKAGNSNMRNPTLASYATKLLPYRGLGSGIRRALRAHKNIDFIDNRDGNVFTCIIKRVAV